MEGGNSRGGEALGVSEGRFPSPHPFPQATQLFGVVVGVNVLTGCGIRGCWLVDGNAARRAGLFPRDGRVLAIF